MMKIDDEVYLRDKLDTDIFLSLRLFEAVLGTSVVEKMRFE
jgi:hypothetical protein